MYPTSPYSPYLCFLLSIILLASVLSSLPASTISIISFSPSTSPSHPIFSLLPPHPVFPLRSTPLRPYRGSFLTHSWPLLFHLPPHLQSIFTYSRSLHLYPLIRLLSMHPLSSTFLLLSTASSPQCFPLPVPPRPAVKYIALGDVEIMGFGTNEGELLLWTHKMEQETA